MQHAPLVRRREARAELAARCRAPCPPAAGRCASAATRDPRRRRTPSRGTAGRRSRRCRRRGRRSGARPAGRCGPRRRSARGGPCPIGQMPRQELQRHGLAELQIVGAVDLAHAAAAEQADDPVALGEDRAGRETAGLDRVGRREPADFRRGRRAPRRLRHRRGGEIRRHLRHRRHGLAAGRTETRRPGNVGRSRTGSGSSWEDCMCLWRRGGLSPSCGRRLLRWGSTAWRPPRPLPVCMKRAAARPPLESRDASRVISWSTSPRPRVFQVLPPSSEVFPFERLRSRR